MLSVFCRVYFSKYHFTETSSLRITILPNLHFLELPLHRTDTNYVPPSGHFFESPLLRKAILPQHNFPETPGITGIPTCWNSHFDHQAMHLIFRGKTVPMLMGRLHLEVRPFGRTDPPLPEAHRPETVQLQSVSEILQQIGSPVSAHETSLIELDV